MAYARFQGRDLMMRVSSAGVIMASILNSREIPT